jgi:hypothetical protein
LKKGRNFKTAGITISNPQAVITTDTSLIAWGSIFQIVEQNIQINEKREIRK